ncbi:MAG TPA: ABC transporter ATP-binding protein [Candidatus Methylomirabilis sp.]|nr:ABC transporter ATP-binding protein [Candidatus Methylomirabilis sp.]HSC70228.1 ABC transporter ATP-binding protein [Candidatus Methylomirabilis sp.]
MLEVQGLSAGYGEIQILRDVSLTVGRGDIVTLVGSNGAGKSTLLNTICGILRPRAGAVRLEGTDITGWTSEAIVGRGITQVPEGRRLFPHMSVRENLLMGAYRRRDRAKIQRDLDWMYALFPILKERQRQRAGSMSGGEQQMCAIGRGLMARPKILILDELSLGLAPIMLDTLVDALRMVHQEGSTIFLVEQDVATAFDLATTGYVLENGRIVLSGPTADLKVNPHVKKSYLGL